jgi:hypothetical protein
MLLLELILVLACTWNKGDVSFEVLCFCYFSTWVVITMLNSDLCWTICEMDVTCDVLCWITTILACMLVGLKSFMISWTTEVIWAQGQKFDRSSDYFCTCALIIWMVPSQLASEQDSTLNISFVYLKQRFLFAKIYFWQLIAIISVFKSKFLIKVR